MIVITGLSNGPVLFCSLASVGRIYVVVCNAASRRAGRPPGSWTVRRPTLHGGPVVLRLVRATPCFIQFYRFMQSVDNCPTCHSLIFTPRRQIQSCSSEAADSSSYRSQSSVFLSVCLSVLLVCHRTL